MLHPLMRRLACLLLLTAALAAGGDTDRHFPPRLQVSDAGATQWLRLTGTATRRFLFFRVYEIGHYIDAEDRRELSVDTVIADGPAKALRIVFARSLERDQIRREFSRSLRRNARPQWLSAAGDTIDAFVAAIDRGAEAGDRLLFYWLAGGRLLADFNGVRSFEATDDVFARLIWSIWFGDDPVCDRDALLARLGTGDPA